MEQNKPEIVGLPVTIFLRNDRFWDFYLSLFSIKFRQYGGKKISNDLFLKLIDSIDCDIQPVMLPFVESIANFKDQKKDKKNFGRIFTSVIFNLMIGQNILKNEFNSVDEIYNSELFKFIYIFLNVYFFQTATLLEIPDQNYFLYSIILKNGFFSTNPKNYNKLKNTDYPKKVQNVFDAVLQLSYKKHVPIEKFTIEKFIELSPDEFWAIKDNFVPLKKNKRRVIKYLDIMLAQVINTTKYQRNIINGLICSQISDIDKEEDFEKRLSIEFNNKINNKKTNWFPGNYKEYLVKYEIEKELKAKDKWEPNYNYSSKWGEIT